MNFAGTTAESGHSSRNLPRWVQLVTGITVFAAILATIIYGTGFLQGDSSAENEPAVQLSPVQRMIQARNRGDWPVVEQACRDQIRLDPFDSQALFNLGFALQRQQRLEEAAEQYRLSRDFIEYRPYSLYNLACIDAVQGRPDDALAHLDTVISEGFVSRNGIAADSDFESLRDDPEFQRLVLVESINRDKQSSR